MLKRFFLFGILVKIYLTLECKSNQILDAFASKCLDCSPSCGSCFNIDDKSCFTCSQDTVKSSIRNNTCVQQCQKYESIVEIDGQKTCVKCQVQGCITCNAEQVCQQCDINFVLDQTKNLCILEKEICQSSTQFIEYPYLAGDCVQTCPQQSYSNQSTQICEQTQQSIRVQSKSSKQFNQQILQIQSINENQYIVRARACNIGLVDENSNIIYSNVLQQVENFDAFYGFLENEGKAISFISGLHGGCSAGKRFIVMNFSTLQIEFNEDVQSDYQMWLIDDTNKLVFLYNFKEYNLVWYDIVAKKINKKDLGLGVGYQLLSSIQGRYYIFYRSYQVATLQKNRTLTFQQLNYSSPKFPSQFVYFETNLILQLYFDEENLKNIFYKVSILNNIPQDPIELISLQCDCKGSSSLSQSLLLAVQYDQSNNIIKLNQFDSQGRQIFDKVILHQAYNKIQVFEDVSLNSFFIFLDDGRLSFANITDFINQQKKSDKDLDFSSYLIPVNSDFIQLTSSLVSMTFESNNIVNLFFSIAKSKYLNFKQIVKIQYKYIDSSFKISYIDSYQTQNYFENGYYSLSQINYSVLLNQMMLYIDQNSNSYSFYSIDQTESIQLKGLNIYKFDLGFSLQNLQKKQKILTKSSKIQLSQNDGVFKYTRFIDNRFIIVSTTKSQIVQEYIIDLSLGQKIFEYTCANCGIQTTVFYIKTKKLLYIQELSIFCDLLQHKVFANLSDQAIQNFIILKDESLFIFITQNGLKQLNLSDATVQTLLQEQFDDFLYSDKQNKNPLISKNDFIYLSSQEINCQIFSIQNSNKLNDQISFLNQAQQFFVAYDPSDEIFVFEQDKIYIFTNTLIYKSTFLDSFEFTVISYDSRYVYFQNGNNFYKLDMELKVIQDLQSKSRNNNLVGIMESTSQIKKEKNIIDTSSMIITKILPEINVYVGQGQWGDTKTHFFQSEKGFNWHKNLFNTPFSTIILTSDQIIVDYDINENKYFVAVFDNYLQQIAIYDIKMSKSVVKQISFSESFDQNIKFLDWQAGNFIYVKGNNLYQYNSQATPPLQATIIINSDIVSYQVCPSKNIAVVQTNTDIFQINLQSKILIQLTDMMLKMRCYNSLSNPISFTLNCDEDLIIVEQPCFFIFSLLTGEPLYDFQVNTLNLIFFFMLQEEFTFILSISFHLKIKYFNNFLQLNTFSLKLFSKDFMQLSMKINYLLSEINQVQFFFFGQKLCSNSVVYYKQQQFVIQYGIFIFHFVQDNTPFPNHLLTSTLLPNALECRFGESELFFDINYNVILAATGSKRHIISMRQAGTYIQPFDYYTQNTFTPEQTHFYQDCQTFLIFDKSQNFYIINYLTYNVTQFQVDAQGIKGLMMEQTQNITFMYSDYNIYAYQFPSMTFIETFSIYYEGQKPLQKLFINQQLSILSVVTETSIVSFDLVESLYTSEINLKQYQNIQNLVLSDEYQVYYSEQNFSINLFNQEAVVDSLLFPPFDYQVYPYFTQMVLIAQNKFIYVYFDKLYILDVNLQTQKLSISKSVTLKESPDNFFFDQAGNQIFILYSKDFQLNSINLSQLVLSEVNIISFTEGVASQALICGDYIILPSVNLISIYSIKTNSINKLNISAGNTIQFVFKLQQKSNQINYWWKVPFEYEERYNSNDYDQSKNQQTNFLCVVSQNQQDSQLTLVNLLSMNLQNNLDIQNTLITNVVNDPFRNKIYAVNNKGMTLVYNQSLENQINIQNNCLKQAAIAFDSNFIYSICPHNIIIYNGLSLKQYLVINTGIQGAYNIVSLKFKNYFFIFQKTKVKLVQINSDSSYKILYENNAQYQELQVLQLKQNEQGQNTLSFIVSSLNDIQKIIYPLTENNSFNQNSNIFIQQQNRSLESTYTSAIIQETAKNSLNQQNTSLQLIEIVYLDQQSIGSIDSEYLNASNTNSNLSLRMQAQSTKDQIYWLNDSVYSKQISIIQILEMQLNVNALALNTQSFMKTFQMSKVTLSVSQSLILSNFASVYLQEVNLIIPNIEIFESITIKNCGQLVIEKLTLNTINSVQNTLIKIINVTSVVINKIDISDLKALSAFSFDTVQNLQIQNVDVKQSQGLQLFSIKQSDNISVDIINIFTVFDSKILDIFGTQASKIQAITIQNSTSIHLFDIQDLQIDTISYKCHLYQLQNIEIKNSTNIQLYSKADKIEIQNVTMIEVINSQNIFNILASDLLLNNTFIEQSQTSKSNTFAFNLISIANLKIQNFTSSHNSIQMIAIKQQEKNGKSELIKSQFYNNQLQGDNPLLSLENIELIEISSVSLRDNIISENSYASLLQISKSNLIKINESNFTNNINNQGIGGAISVTETQQIQLLFVKFQGNVCSKQTGGAVNYVNSINQGLLSANYTYFWQNQAPTSIGGAINLDNINVKMLNSELFSNKAQIGGAIFYQSLIPDFVLQIQKRVLNNYNQNNNTFDNNFAEIFGQNIGSTLRKIQLDLNRISGPKTTQIDFQNNVVIISNIQSGSQIAFDNINILDEEDNPIQIPSANNQKTISNEVIKIINQIFVQIICDQNNLQIQCLGDLKSNDFSQGGFILIVQLIYKPQSNMQFQIVSNQQSSLIDSNGNTIINQGQLNLNVQINFSQCQIGQILKQFSQSIICEQCKEGKYSLNIYDTQCNQCPDSAVKCEGSQIQLKDGYWRSSELSDEIIYCSFNPAACKAESPDSKQYCDKGHVGVTCNNCDVYGEVWGERYAENFSSGICQKCNENTAVIIFNNLIKIIFVISYIFFMIGNLQKQVYIKLVGHYITKSGLLFLGNSYKSDKSKIFSKILTDHLQILSLVCGMFNVPLSITLPVQITGNPLNSISKSIDCIISNDSDTKPLWFYNLLWSLFLPVLTLIAYLLLGVILNLFKRRSTLQFIRSAAIFIYFQYFISIVTILSRSLNCFSVGNEKYMDLDLNIKCYDTEDHLPYVLFFTLPLLIMYGILIPVLLFVKLYLMHKKKVSIIIKTQYSFIFAGFRDSLFYWEFYKIFYKTSLILIFVLLKQNPLLQVALVNILMITNFFLIVKLSPYSRKIYNNYSIQSTFICALTLNLYFIQSYSAKIEETEVLVMLIVGFLNLQFLIRLIFGIIKLVIPKEKEDRNVVEEFIFYIKKKFPRMFENITIQNKKNIAILLKLKIVQQKIRGLMQSLKSKSIYNIAQIQKDVEQKNAKIAKESMTPIIDNLFNSNSEISNVNQTDFPSSARNKWDYYTRMTKSIKLQNVKSGQKDFMSPIFNENSKLARVDSDLNLQEGNFKNIYQQRLSQQSQFYSPQSNSEALNQNLKSGESENKLELDALIQNKIKEQKQIQIIYEEDKQKFSNSDEKKQMLIETNNNLVNQQIQNNQQQRQSSQLNQLSLPQDTETFQREKTQADQTEKLINLENLENNDSHGSRDN